MIIPDSKCVVNGSKVNDVIIALNPLLNIEARFADVVEPQVQYGKDGVQVIIPQPSNFANEELDVVDSNNTASTRWFITATSQGESPSANEQSGVPVNKTMPSTTSQNRGKLKTQGGGGSQSNRSSLNRAAGGGSGSQTTSTAPSQATPSQAAPSQATPSQVSPSQLQQLALSQDSKMTSPLVGDDVGDNIPLTASGQVDLSRMTEEQKQKYGMTDNIPI